MFTVNFSEIVDVSSGSRLMLDVGGSNFFANCNSQSSVSFATCSYNVGTEQDHDGISIVSFQLNGSTIDDLYGNILIDTSFIAIDTSSILINSSGLPVFEWEESSTVISSYDFGDPDTNVSVTFTINNVGNKATTSSNFLVSITNDPDSVYSITTDNCSGLEIAPNGSCTVTILYLDVDPATTKTGEVTISDLGAIAKNLTLTGTR